MCNNLKRKKLNYSIIGKIKFIEIKIFPYYFMQHSFSTSQKNVGVWNKVVDLRKKLILSTFDKEVFFYFFILWVFKCKKYIFFGFNLEGNYNYYN